MQATLERKYLTEAEINGFLTEARNHGVKTWTLCWLMIETGFRISEALELNIKNIDFGSKYITVRCLKKRAKIVYRTVPVSDHLIEHLLDFSRSVHMGRRGMFWEWTRMTAYRHIISVMNAAHIEGSYANPRGLRHSFGVHAIQSGVPINIVQRWLGHADLKTTSVYTNIVGPEERSIAERMWNLSSVTKAKLVPYQSQTPASIGLYSSNISHIQFKTHH